jgi:hypothetical protein
LSDILITGIGLHSEAFGRRALLHLDCLLLGGRLLLLSFLVGLSFGLEIVNGLVLCRCEVVIAIRALAFG